MYVLLLEKYVHAHLGYQILESHGRLDKTIHVENSVKGCCLRQLRVVF